MENFIFCAVSVTAAKLGRFGMCELVVCKFFRWVSFCKDYTASEFVIFFWSVFSPIRAEYEDKLCIKFKYGKMRNMKNYEFELFHSVLLSRILEYLPTVSRFINL